MDRKSQNEEILAWLQKGNKIDPLLALEKFGCFRLGGRIYELKQAGNRIVTEMVTKNGKRYASYSLEKSNGS